MLPNDRGRFAWLDSRTLAITTFAGDPRAPSSWMSNRVVAFDTKTGQLSTLVPQGRLMCTNPAARVASLSVGDTRAYFKSSEVGPPPVSTWFRWSEGTRRLDPWPDGERQGWNEWVCRQVLPDDARKPMPGTSDRPRQYLQAGDGYITWRRAFDDTPRPVRLKVGARDIGLNAKSSEISPVVTHLPFMEAYLLSAGAFRWTSGRGAQDTPAVVLRPGGAIDRPPFPPSLEAHFTQQQLHVDAVMIPVSRGSLVIVGTQSAHGGGMYLTRGGRSTRIWCAGASAYEPCKILSAIELSPDGCQVAFDARVPRGRSAATAGLEGSVKVIDLCRTPS